MHLTVKDRIASALVGAGALAWALWSLGLGPQGAAGARGVTGIILGLGFAASASAVVPGFDRLIHGSKAYLAGASLLGAGALAAGVAALLTGGELALGLLVAATLTLWAVTTARHSTAP